MSPCIHLDCALNSGLWGCNKDPETFDSSPSFPSILLYPCTVRNCPSFLGEGRREESDGKSLELGRGKKKIRYPFPGVNETSESINSLCFEDLFYPNLLSCHLHSLLEIPFLMFKLIFEISFLRTFSTSAIFSMTWQLGNFFACLFYLDLTEGWAIFVVKPKCKCLATTLIS